MQLKWSGGCHTKFTIELGSAIHVVLALEAQGVQELRVVGSSTEVSES